MSVKDDVALNINELDKEWERQSALMEEYSSALSTSNREYSNMKLVLDGMTARLKMEWREKGEISTPTGKVKLTEGALSDAVDSNEEVTKQKQLMIEMQFEIDTLKGIVSALQNKKSALEAEVSLYLSGYFSSPKDQRTMIKERQR